MSQSDNFAKWLFKHFVSDTPELDFSQVLDLQDEVRERQNRIVSLVCVICVRGSVHFNVFKLGPNTTRAQSDCS